MSLSPTNRPVAQPYPPVVALEIAAPAPGASPRGLGLMDPLASANMDMLKIEQMHRGTYKLPLAKAGGMSMTTLYKEPNDNSVWPTGPHPRGACADFYYRWINPWLLFFVLFLPLLYLYAVMLEVVSIRNYRFNQDLMGNYPLPRNVYPSLDGTRNNRHGFTLPDLLYDVIDAATFPSARLDAWKLFIDISAAGLNVLVLVLCLLRRDSIRFFEWASAHFLLFIAYWFAKMWTTHPAPNYYSPSCYDSKYASTGRYIWNPFTVDFCGDQMFSGHMSEVLLALIMIKRIMWDIVGWNFHWNAAVQQYRDEQTAARLPYLPARLHPSSQGPTIGVADPVDRCCSRGRFNSHSQTSDIFLHQRNVYASPHWVHAGRKFVYALTWLVRLATWVWVGLVFYALIHIRQHYTADILVAIMIVSMLTHLHTALQWLVRWFYRPNYWNYRRKGWFHPVHLTEPINAEQINYETRIKRVGKGGWI